MTQGSGKPCGGCRGEGGGPREGAEGWACGRPSTAQAERRGLRLLGDGAPLGQVAVGWAGGCVRGRQELDCARGGEGRGGGIACTESNAAMCVWARVGVDAYVGSLLLFCRPLFLRLAVAVHPERRGPTLCAHRRLNPETLNPTLCAHRRELVGAFIRCVLSHPSGGGVRTDMSLACACEHMHLCSQQRREGQSLHTGVFCF